MVEIRHLVDELRRVAQDEETVGKALRYIHLFFILPGQDLSMPFSVGAASLSQIDSHVENLSVKDADELALRVADLVVQAAEHAFGGHALIVLDENHVEPGFLHISLIVGLHKIAAVVPVYCRFYDHQSFNRCLSHFNLSQFFLRSRLRL